MNGKRSAVKTAVRQSWFPPGYDGVREGKLVGAWLGVSVLYTCIFLLRYRNLYQALFMVEGGKRVLRPGAVMTEFAVLFQGALNGFWVGFVLLGAVMVWHYLYFYHGSKSIYLMRRLPKKRVLLKMCVAAPLAEAFIFVLVMLFMRLFWHSFYMWVTPAPCLPSV